MFAYIFGKIIVILFCFILTESTVTAQVEQDDVFLDSTGIYKAIEEPHQFAAPKARFLKLRRQMVQEQIIARGIKDKRVLAAMQKVPRHKFVPGEFQRFAYQDRPLPIGYEQTISQPYIVALMTELVRLNPDDKVLEIGTGSGYQAAILAEIAKEVYTIEILKPLAESSRTRLKELGYGNIQVKWGDGYLGWKKFAPYDAIIVTCAPEEVPEALVVQLQVGGRLVVPVGSFFQELKLIIKTETGLEEESIIPVRFVPMIKR